MRQGLTTKADCTWLREQTVVQIKHTPAINSLHLLHTVQTFQNLKNVVLHSRVITVYRSIITSQLIRNYEFKVLLFFLIFGINLSDSY